MRCVWKAGDEDEFQVFRPIEREELGILVQSSKNLNTTEARRVTSMSTPKEIFDRVPKNALKWRQALEYEQLTRFSNSIWKRSTSIRELSPSISALATDIVSMVQILEPVTIWMRKNFFR